MASRLEQRITRICGDEDETTSTGTNRNAGAAATQQQQGDDDTMGDDSTAASRGGEHTASETSQGGVLRSESSPATQESVTQTGASAISSANNEQSESQEGTADTASVLALASSFGESSMLRSPPESDVDADTVEEESESLSQGREASVSSSLENAAVESNTHTTAPPPAPMSLPSGTAASVTSLDPMLNITLDLSGFGVPSTQAPASSGGNYRGSTVEEESKTEELSAVAENRTSSVDSVTQELSATLLDQQEQPQEYQCPEGVDAEVFASLPPDMQAEIVAQNASAITGSTSTRSDTATAGGGAGESESMSQMDLDMANSSFDRETLEALPPDIRAEVLENERREREAAARAETADTSRAQEMDNASFVASLAPELREEILITCDDAFLQTLPSQVRAEAMVLRERAAFRTYRERDRGTEGRAGGGEVLELVLSPLERLRKTNTENEESKHDDERDSSSTEPGSEWVAVPTVELDDTRMSEIVAVLSMDLCTPQMQERTLAVLKLLNYVEGNRELVIRAIVRHASTLARAERYMGRELLTETSAYESSAVLPSAQDELKLLRLLHSLSDVCANTAEFTECCQTIGLDPLWDSLSLSLAEARAKGGLDEQDSVIASSSPTAASSTPGAAANTDSVAADGSEGTIIEGKSAGASCAMAALLARFLPMVEAFFVVNARDAASMKLHVPDSTEREEAVVAALRVGGFDATANMEDTEAKTSPMSMLRRSSSALSTTMSEAGESMRLANFVESNRVLLNLLVREKPSLLDTSLAALIKMPRCRAYLAFDNKRTYFHSAMKRLRQTALRNHGGGSSSVRIPVRREHIFEDSYYALRMRNGTELRRKLHISFTGEEGIDAGGVTREWYMILAREMFNPNYVLFTSAADSPTFQPNPLSYVNKDHLSYFEFVGKVLGKAVADGQLLDAHFTRSFYKHILQLPISYHDMEAIDPEYYRNLHSILDNSISDLGLELTFSAEQSNFGKVEVVDLIPNGRNVNVTDENKMEYVKLVTHHRMATGIRQQIDSFLKGFHQLVPPELIAIFNENELELLISGMPEIDIDDLKANTEYANFKPTDAVIRWFWNVLYSFTHEERALFLQFVTGTSKVPLEGFKALEGMRGTQKFNIHKAFGNNSALPSAHTCFNQLDLPDYENEEKLKQCLLLAIREGSEGFGFG
ncbi:hypothetical protein PHYBOEH_003640 [Phytophthora boehmeriae]|uniref:HECT-type E3 ubiquitin transferase n=1 Tax=Phytophthora boehmeriae TaxID=109152 RepID=A0A8T1WQQ9_9STRA|nr:hypothetical protein PHYBOEH_003640 [Phytophthora boehmeriae]